MVVSTGAKERQATHGMRHNIDALNGLIERAFGSDVLHLDELEPIPIFAERVVEMPPGLLYASYCTADRVAVLQILLCHPCANVAIDAGDENLSGCRDSRHC